MVTNFSVMDIRRPVMAVVDSLDAGKGVFFTKKYGSAIVPEENLEIKVTGEFIPMERKNGVFEVPVDVISVEGDELCAAVDEDAQAENPGAGRQRARSRRHRHGPARDAGQHRIRSRYISTCSRGGLPRYYRIFLAYALIWR